MIAEQNELRSELLAHSILGGLGKAIEPLVKPLGWDWRIAARRVTPLDTPPKTGGYSG